MMNPETTRRGFLGSTLGALVAGAVGTVADSTVGAEHPPTFRLNYLLGTCMYGTLPLAEIVPEVHAIGAQEIDVWPRVHGDQREQIDAMGMDAFRALLAQHDVGFGMSTRYDLGPFALADEIRFVKALGGRMIVTGAKNAEGKTLREQVQAFVKQLEPTRELAEEHGVTVAIENHGNSLIASPDSMRYFAEFAKSERLGIAFAPYHLPQDAEALGRLIRDLGPKLVHFYAWQHGEGSMKKLPKEREMLQLPGRGPLDFGPMLRSLREIGYAGWTEIFMHPVPRGTPILPTAGQVTGAIVEARAYLDAIVVMD